MTTLKFTLARNELDDGSIRIHRLLGDTPHGRRSLDAIDFNGGFGFASSTGYPILVREDGARAGGGAPVLSSEEMAFGGGEMNMGNGGSPPVAGDDDVFIDEDAGIYESGAASVLDNDFDYDGDPLSVVEGRFAGAYGTLILNADGTYSYVLSESAQALGRDAKAEDGFGYTVFDDDGSDTGALVFHIVGVNDAPTANPDAARTTETDAIAIDVLANDGDVDEGSVLTLVAVSVDAGQGIVSIEKNQVLFDPGRDFDHLADGESATVIVNYAIEDEHGFLSSSEIEIIVEGQGKGEPGRGTEAGETLFGTPEDDMLDALGGDDRVFGLAGRDFILGGEGNDYLNGEADDDFILGGNGDDVLAGGRGSDELHGQAGSDIAAGENGDDLISGGDGFDQLSGEAGDDLIEGGNDDDLLWGGSGHDKLSGGAGDDNLEGGHGDDALDGGDGDDFLSDLSGINDFAGGLGADHILAGASDGAQTIDGGDGDDVIRVQTRDHASVITTGAGSDTIELAHAGKGRAAIVVTDFTPGKGGDVFRLSSDGASLLSLLVGWDGSSNPFGSGFLQLRKEGEDTLLQWDRDGPAGASEWETLAVFRNTYFADFTAANFAPGYEPDGSAPKGDTIVGTEEDDVLIGTFGADTIDALGGNDFIFAGAGADWVLGGDGTDQVYGGADDDVVEGGGQDDYAWGGDGGDRLYGEDGNDGLFGEKGDDQLSGGAGDDGLDGGDGDDTLDGGEGEDFLTGGLGSNLLIGGLGGDRFLAHSSDGAQTIDGGDGDDVIRLHYRHHESWVTTGEGSDTIELADADQGRAALVITDFTPGKGGDVFRLSGEDGSLLSLLIGWDGSSNPFGSGHLRLLKAGDDTLLQWDRDGREGPAKWETLVIFQNSWVGDFTAANFLPAYHPGGLAPVGETFTGTKEDDVIAGTIGPDTIDALGGNDFVDGGSGADLIQGGDGSDQLYGGTDDDIIEGGGQDDFAQGGDGRDKLFGGSGNDNLDGGAGDDEMDGGDGDDFLSDLSGINGFAGGLGADYIVASASDGAQTIDGGDGDDVIRLSYRDHASLVTTGAGSDTIELVHADKGRAAMVVTDFTAGQGGDVFRLSGDGGAVLSLLIGWDQSSNPFGSGFLQLQKDGADTILQWDRDGAAGGYQWETLAVFRNAYVGDFIAANFGAGYHPDGSAPKGEAIIGTAEDDMLVGTVGADTIEALGGKDFVLAGAGADLVLGGDGVDQIYGGADDDIVEGGGEDDYAWGGDGGDRLLGEGGNDSLFGEAGDDRLLGGIGDDSLDGGDGDDKLVGGDGEDFLTGGAGFDLLVGGAGTDYFNFAFPGEGPDEIDDFAPGIDQIRISARNFGGDLIAGGTVSLVSGSAPTATRAHGQFLYDTDNGQLLWDEDGTGSGAAVLVATFSNIPTISASDFFIVF